MLRTAQASVNFFNFFNSGFCQLYPSKYIPRQTLNELCKLYVRPHLDYCDVIYHNPAKVCEFSNDIILPRWRSSSEYSIHGGIRREKSCTQSSDGNR